MTNMIEQKLQMLQIKLPEASSPAANYVPFIKTGNLVFISGQLTSWNGSLKFVGSVGKEFSLEDGYEAARICGLNILSQLKIACNSDLDQVKQVVKLGGFVNSSVNFVDQPKVINGASDLMVAVFGDKIGTHTRFAVSVPSLPLGSAVEVDGVFELNG